ncbi:MAG: hypothetical protein KJ774_13340 [Firmicutes bacterium]|nr:hypothetical protein [Bacillota bacterium]
MFTETKKARNPSRLDRSCRADNPSCGQLSATQTVTFPNRGYCTVKLNSPVNLTASQRFAVMIKYTPQMLIRSRSSVPWPIIVVA